MEIKIANQNDEWLQAFALLKTRFEDKGLITKAESKYYFRSYDALADTTLFIAKKENKVVATTTLVWDNGFLGLPCESVYEKEINSCRQAGERLAEGGMIATDYSLGYQEAYFALFEIVKLEIQYFYYHGGQRGITTAHPKHGKFYQKKFGFELFGDEKLYPKRQNKPVQAYSITKCPFSTEGIDSKLVPAIMPLEVVDRLRQE